MYGIIPKTREFEKREQKLEELQKNNREVLNMKELYEQLNASFENLRKEVSLLSSSVQAIRVDLYGDENEEDDEDPNSTPSGFVNTFRLRLDGQRDEYYALVEKYMNELDRKRLEGIEQRIARLEDKPKMNLISSTKMPTLEIEKKPIEKPKK